MASEGDLMKDALQQKGQSASEEYYRFKLMQEKLVASTGGDSTAAASKQLVSGVLGKLTDLEKIRIRILGDISNYSEASPEYAQLVAITGGKKSYFEIADALANLVWNKMQAEQVLATYTPSKGDLTKEYNKSATLAANKRIARMTDGAAFLSEFSSAADDAGRASVAKKIVSALTGARDVGTNLIPFAE